ncbi:MAG: gliding motility lipoprotein GldH [Marinoscillum sp.]
MKHFIWVTLFFVLVACDSNRVFEENEDLTDRVWLEENILDFEFEIEDATKDYSIYANIRNTKDYPFYNLYYHYSLLDSLGKPLKKDLMNIDLFHPKTGEPYGSGLGDMFDHQQVVLSPFSFPDAGRYTIRMEQYMRRDSLHNVVSVGVRVEKNKE